MQRGCQLQPGPCLQRQAHLLAVRYRSSPLPQHRPILMHSAMQCIECQGKSVHWEIRHAFCLALTYTQSDSFNDQWGLYLVRRSFWRKRAVFLCNWGSVWWDTEEFRKSQQDGQKYTHHHQHILGPDRYIDIVTDTAFKLRCTDMWAVSVWYL